VIIFGDCFSKIMIKAIQCLTDDEIKSCLNTLNKLEDYYQTLPEGFNFKTLGAASYLHYGGEDENNEPLGDKYNRIKKEINPILIQNFKWLYDILIKKLTEELGEPCEISEESDLAFPGFHIFYPYENCEEVSHPAHLDYQWTYHLDSLRSKFDNLNLSKFLTFTLSIKLPHNGAGLYYWDLPDYNKQYSFEEVEILIEDILKKAGTLFAIHDGSIPKKDYEKETIPSILNYKEGYITIFTQPILHQIMPFNHGWKKDDIRITLQGHGIMCDNIWRLYF
jgi:hypothetical protein